MTVSNWARLHNASLMARQLVVTQILDDIDYLVDVNDLNAGPAVGANFVLLNNGLNPDPLARCVVVTMVNDAAGAARTIRVRLEGVNQFGETVVEELDFAGGAGLAATTYVLVSRRAYLYLTRIQYVSRAGGAVQANDRLDVGITRVPGTVVGTVIANGSVGHKGFGLPIPVIEDTLLGAVIALDFPTQIFGSITTEAGTGISTVAAMSKAGDFGVDVAHSTMAPDEDLAVTVGIIEMRLWIQTNRGE